eukprot:TRINITY_DN1200_c0_g1_i10.p3 TRINITY_DN1200_c0_g1~~TRINITY_DN1200_c0_g1_i10.p3  ORF type:complete len:134 (+),score=12.03 TRINITY_DN1200_c0_g1_i10:959-1360(+)
MEHSLTKNQSLPALLCAFAACYGIGFGTMMIPAGLFVGWQILLGAAIHIIFGSAFLGAAVGIRSDSTWAAWLATTLSAVIVGLSIVGILQSAAHQDAGGVIVWTFISIYFACLVLLACRAGLSLSKSRTSRST